MILDLYRRRGGLTMSWITGSYRRSRTCPAKSGEEEPDRGCLDSAGVRRRLVDFGDLGTIGMREQGMDALPLWLGMFATQSRLPPQPTPTTVS